MKGNKLAIYSIFLATLIYIIIFKIVVLEKFVDLSMYISLFFTFGMVVISSILFGFSREKKGILRYSTIQTIIIYIVIYYILIYIFGIFVGFLKSIYSLNIIDILKNIYLVIPIIILEEIFRYILVQKSRKNILRLSIITILFVILNIIMEINYYDFTSFESIFKFIALSLLPALASNALLTFIANKIGYLPNILYRLILEIPVFLLPIFPNIGEYLECILGILLPFLIFVKINNLSEQSERIPNNKMSTLKWYVVIPVVSVLVVLVILVSGFFKYHMIAVGSNSMYPTIKRGDAIILMKVESEEIQNLQEGEILVFRHDNKVVLHRIVDVVYKNGEYQFTTKGDNNNANDNFITTSENVIGIVKVKIPYIGYPTVFLNDMFTAD